MPATDAIPTAIADQLDRWFDEGDRAALDRACELAAVTPLELPALLDWVQSARAPATARHLAARALRWRLGLPVVAGAPCRKNP